MDDGDNAEWGMRWDSWHMWDYRGGARGSTKEDTLWGFQRSRQKALGLAWSLSALQYVLVSCSESVDILPAILRYRDVQRGVRRLRSSLLHKYRKLEDFKRHQPHTAHARGNSLFGRRGRFQGASATRNLRKGASDLINMYNDCA